MKLQLGQENNVTRSVKPPNNVLSKVRLNTQGYTIQYYNTHSHDIIILYKYTYIIRCNSDFGVVYGSRQISTEVVGLKTVKTEL